MNDDTPDQENVAFPKPKPREKRPHRGLKRSGLKRSGRLRGRGRSGFTTPQQQERKQHEMLYRRTVRPKYLLDLARRQGRLKGDDDGLPGDDLRQKLVLLPTRSKPLCEVQAPGTGCEGKGGKVANQIHHRAGRGRRKSAPHLLTDTSKFVGICGECHDFCESNREWAYKHGWLERRNDTT